MSFAGLVTSLGSVADSANRSAYTCPISGAPLANSLVLVAVSHTSASPQNPTDVSGAGMVFSLITGLGFSPIATPGYNVSLWRSMAAAPTGSLITVTLAGQATNCIIQVSQCSGVSTSGTSGANAVGQSSISSMDGGNPLRVIGPSANSTANGWFAVHSSNSSEIASVNNSYQTVDQVSSQAPDMTLTSAWTTLSTGDVSFTASGNDNRGGIIIELVGDNPAAAASPNTLTYVRQFRQPDRIPPVPVSITGDIAAYLKQVVRILNAEAYISKFSGTNPNTSNVTGIPGNLVVNVGSASTWTRLWVMGGSIQSISTTGWQMLRTA